MKKTLLVILALVMALTLVMGSISTISATGKPVVSVLADITGVDSSGIHYTISWNNFPTTEYSFYFYDNKTTGPISGQWSPFVRKVKDFSWSEIARGSAIYTGDGRIFTITLTVVNKKGETIVASDTWIDTSSP